MRGFGRGAVRVTRIPRRVYAKKISLLAEAGKCNFGRPKGSASSLFPIGKAG
jgi:hypothetical protein